MQLDMKTARKNDSVEAFTVEVSEQLRHTAAAVAASPGGSAVDYMRICNRALTTEETHRQGCS